MTHWKEDKRWSDVFIPEIKTILAPFIISEAPLDEDKERATDLMVLKANGIRTGCRIRRPKFFDAYSNDITIRSRRNSGSKTELAKIIEGWGDYFFYGHADENKMSLRAWVLIDLGKFRLWFNSEIVRNNGIIPGQPINNTDGRSTGIAFDIRKFSPGIVIATSGIKFDIHQKV